MPSHAPTSSAMSSSSDSTSPSLEETARKKRGRVSSGTLDDRLECKICGKFFKAMGTHLAWAHQITADEYRKRYGQVWLVSKVTRAQMSEGKRKYPRQQAYRPLEHSEILGALQALARQKGRMPAYTWLKRHDPGLAQQAYKAFGNWRKALNAAGLSGVHPRRWDPQTVLAEIRARAERGERLTYDATAAEMPWLLSASCRMFGTWSKAVAAAGYDLERIRRENWICAKDRFAERLRAWVRQHGSLNPSQLLQSDPRLWRAMHSHFGGARKAGQALSLPVTYENNYALLAPDERRKHTECELRAWVNSHGPLVTSRLKKDYAGLCARVVKTFGSVREAAEALNLPYVNLRRKKKVHGEGSLIEK